jgi:O-antigen/teichoic acid export membrane protein
MKLRQMRHVAARFTGSQFGKNTLWMAISTMAGQMIMLASLPFMTRLYTTDQYAVFTAYTSAHAICMAFITYRFDVLLPNKRSARETASLLTISVLAVFVLAAASIAALLSFDISGELLKREGGLLFSLLGFSLLFGGMQAALQAWYVWKNDQRVVSISRFSYQAGNALLPILCALPATGGLLGTYGLIFGFLGAGALAVVILLSSSAQQKEFWQNWHPGDLVRDFRSNFRLATVSTASAIATAVSYYLPVFLALNTFSTDDAAKYGLTFRLVAAPIALVLAAVNKAFWGQAAEYAKTDPVRLKKLYLKTTLVLLVLATALSVFLLAGPLYVEFVFGADWRGAGAMLAASVPFFIAVISFAITHHLYVYDKQHWQLGLDIFTILLLALGFWIASSLNLSPALQIAVWGGAFFVGYALRFPVHLIAINRHISNFETRTP